MTDTNWIEKTTITSLLLGLPAAVLFGSVYWPRFRGGYRAARMNFSVWIGLVVLFLYACSILNIIFQWSVSFMVAWPLFGIALTFLGLGLAFSSRAGERWKLISANLLLLILVLASIVLPN